jgi:hypothetical protein
MWLGLVLVLNVFVCSEGYNVVRVSAGVERCSTDVRRFCSSSATVVILTIAKLVLVMMMLPVNCPPTDFRCKARLVDWVWESRDHLVSVQIILALRRHKKEHQLLAYGSVPSKIKWLM